MVAVLAWTMWGVLLVALLAAMVMVSLDRQHSPEVSAGMGPLVVGLLLLILAAVGGLLYWLSQRQFHAAMIAVMVVLGVPLVVLVARPAVLAFKSWRLEREEARVGDFRDPALRSMAEAIRAGDAATLAQLLRDRPAPAERDSAGNDILAVALLEVWNRRGDPACVRVLLEAGVDPRGSRTSEGLDPLNLMIVDSSPAAKETVLLLVRHGADVNAVDPIDGETPIVDAGYDSMLVRALVDAGADFDRLQPDGLTALVRYTGAQFWDSAIFLVERGADLDVSDDSGISVDYYLSSLERSVYAGTLPEAARRLKQAIALRRAADAAGAPAGSDGR